jgi:hypothetical protein
MSVHACRYSADRQKRAEAEEERQREEHGMLNSYGDWQQGDAPPDVLRLESDDDGVVDDDEVGDGLVSRGSGSPISSLRPSTGSSRSQRPSSSLSQQNRGPLSVSFAGDADEHARPNTSPEKRRDYERSDASRPRTSPVKFPPIPGASGSNSVSTPKHQEPGHLVVDSPETPVFGPGGVVGGWSRQGSRSTLRPQSALSRSSFGLPPLDKDPWGRPRTAEGRYVTQNSKPQISNPRILESYNPK